MSRRPLRNAAAAPSCRHRPAGRAAHVAPPTAAQSSSITAASNSPPSPMETSSWAREETAVRGPHRGRPETGGSGSGADLFTPVSGSVLSSVIVGDGAVRGRIVGPGAARLALDADLTGRVMTVVYLGISRTGQQVGTAPPFFEPSRLRCRRIVAEGTEKAFTAATQRLSSGNAKCALATGFWGAC